MADTLTWNGSASGDVNVAANYTPAQVPIDGDSVIVDGTTTQNMTASLGTFAALKFVSFFVGPDATIDIGTSATDGDGLRFAATKIVNQGSGTFYYEAVATGVNATNEIVVNSPNRELAMSINATAAATIVDVAVASGNVAFSGSGITMQFLRTSYRSSVASDVTITSTGSFAFAATAHIGGGNVTSNILGTNTFVMGGTLTVSFNSATSSTGNIFIGNGAEVVFKDDATIPLAELRSGTLDFTQLSRELIVTILRRWPGTTLKTNELVTITTTEDMTGGDVD